MPDLIPRPDAEYSIWQSQLVSAAQLNTATLGLTPAQATALGDVQDTWTDAYTGHIATKNAAEAAAQTKDEARAAQEAQLRDFIGQWQANPAVNDALRATLGITIRDETRTPAAVPGTRPELEADTSQRLQLTIHFRDQGATNKAKPPGVRGSQLWMQTGGTAPTGLTGTDYLATDTRTPYVVHFEPEDAGKTVHILGRWENTRGETGPLSEVLTVVVPG